MKELFIGQLQKAGRAAQKPAPRTRPSLLPHPSPAFKMAEQEPKTEEQKQEFKGGEVLVCGATDWALVGR